MKFKTAIVIIVAMAIIMLTTIPVTEPVIAQNAIVISRPTIEVATEETPEEPPLIEEKSDELQEKIAKMMVDYREEPGSTKYRIDYHTAYTYAGYFIKYCEIYTVDLYKAIGMCWYESGFDKNNVSSSGAVGLMQIMPSTAAGLGVTKEQLYDPEINIKTGIMYLSLMLDAFDGDYSRALMAYNKGIGNVKRNNISRGGYERTVHSHSAKMREKVEKEGR